MYTKVYNTDTLVHDTVIHNTIHFIPNIKGNIAKIRFNDNGGTLIIPKPCAIARKFDDITNYILHYGTYSSVYICKTTSKTKPYVLIYVDDGNVIGVHIKAYDDLAWDFLYTN